MRFKVEPQNAQAEVELVRAWIAHLCSLDTRISGFLSHARVERLAHRDLRPGREALAAWVVHFPLIDEMRSSHWFWPMAWLTGAPARWSARWPLRWKDAAQALTRAAHFAGFPPHALRHKPARSRLVLRGGTHASHLLDLEYVAVGGMSSRCDTYARAMADFNDRIQRVDQKLARYPENSQAPTFLSLIRHRQEIDEERARFVASHPDPSHIEPGLWLSVEGAEGAANTTLQAAVMAYFAQVAQILAPECLRDADAECRMFAQRLSASASLTKAA